MLDMKLRRLVLFLFAVLPGLVIAVACAVLFVSDLAVYRAIPAQAQQLSSPYGTSGSAVGNTMTTILDHGLRTLLRINLFESGAGIVMGLILAAIGINGICQLGAKDCLIECSALRRLCHLQPR